MEAAEIYVLCENKKPVDVMFDRITALARLTQDYLTTEREMTTLRRATEHGIGVGDSITLVGWLGYGYTAKKAPDRTLTRVR